MISRFGRPTPLLSMVTNKVVDFIYDTHGRRVMEWNHDLHSQAHLQIYVNAVHAKGAALETCFGFVDDTVRPIAGPNENQRSVYNVHKGCMPLNFNLWLYPMVSLQTCMDLLVSVLILLWRKSEFL